MTTLLIRLEYPAPGDHLAIRGFHVSYGTGGWHEDAGPVKEIPRDVTIETSNGKVSLEKLAQAAPPLPAVQLGKQLWEIVADGDVGAWWHDQIAKAGDAPVRTLLDIEPPELRSVPWELMYPPHGLPVFRDPDRPWVRAKTNWSPLKPLEAPVQVLVLIGETGAPELDVDREIDAIHRCLREKPASWHIQVLYAPTAVQFRSSYEEFEPDILHVIGHSEKYNGQDVLRIVPDGGSPWRLTVEDVPELRPRLPNLVVLNCCRTTAAGTVADPLWTFSEAFLTRGSAAVLTMQGDIPSAAATTFTSAFYSDILAGKPIDAAAARARLQVRDVMVERQDQRSWAMPSLYVGTDPDRVLPVTECLSRAELDNPPFASAFGLVEQYLDRTDERRMLLRALDAQESPRTLLITGHHLDGRSAVLRSTLYTLRVRGRNTVYVDLDDARGSSVDPGLSWLQVLRQIRDDVWEWVPDIPAESRRRFTHELGYLLNRRDPEPWSADLDERDDEQEFDKGGEDYREWISKIVVAFRRMLARATKDYPLLLALDSLGAVDDDDLRDVLAGQLLLPLTTGKSKDGIDADIRCLITSCADELMVIPEAIRRPLARTDIPIKPFRRDELPRLVGEYIARRNLRPPMGWRSHVEGLLSNMGDEILQPGELSGALRTFEKFLPRS